MSSGSLPVCPPPPALLLGPRGRGGLALWLLWLLPLLLLLVRRLLLLLLLLLSMMAAAPALLVLLLLGRLRRLAGLAPFALLAAPAMLLRGRVPPWVILAGCGLLRRAPPRVS